VLDAIYGEDKLATRAQFSATFARDWGNIPAHGGRVSYGAHDFYDFREGKVVHAWYANDTLSAARQFGVVDDDGKVIGVDATAS
jgi:predicted ester cyclase